MSPTRPRFPGAMLRSATLACLLLLAACATTREAAESPDMARNAPRVLRGRASWYGKGFHGRPTASGEPFDERALTAAHRTLPFGTRVRVRNLRNGRTVVVRVNDRGPYAGHRLIDVSWAAARALDMVDDGEAPVELEPLPAP